MYSTVSCSCSIEKRSPRERGSSRCEGESATLASAFQRKHDSWPRHCVRWWFPREENKPSGPIAITINAAKALGQRFLIFDPRAREEQKAVVSHSPAKNGDVLERVLEHDKDVTMVAGSKCDPTRGRSSQSRVDGWK